MAPRLPDRAANRSERWKYILNLDRFEELYDLEADPFELDNLRGTQPATPEVVRAAEHLRRRTGELLGTTSQQ